MSSFSRGLCGFSTRGGGRRSTSADRSTTHYLSGLSPCCQYSSQASAACSALSNLAPRGADRRGQLGMTTTRAIKCRMSVGIARRSSTATAASVNVAARTEAVPIALWQRRVTHSANDALRASSTIRMRGAWTNRTFVPSQTAPCRGPPAHSPPRWLARSRWVAAVCPRMTPAR